MRRCGAHRWCDLPVCEMERASERERPRQKGRETGRKGGRRGGEGEGGEGETVRRRRAHVLEKPGKRQITRCGFKRRSAP